MLPTIDLQDDGIVMVDQRKLPAQEVYVRCRTAPEVAKAIRTMVIRGAPAIGVAAAMGIAVGMRRSTAKGTHQFTVEFQKLCDLMAATRPTAVNLFWAIDRLKRTFAEGAQAGESPAELVNRLEREARAIHDEDVANCRAMGQHGAAMVPDGARVLTHCNAGALATAGYGSALGVIRAAVEAGKENAVFAGETRPFRQGARLTAWKSGRDGTTTTFTTESWAGRPRRQGKSTWSSSARIGSRPTATPRTRSAPTPLRSLRTSTESPSSWRRRSRRSISRRRMVTGFPSRSATSARSATSVRRGSRRKGRTSAIRRST